MSRWDRIYDDPDNIIANPNAKNNRTTEELEQEDKMAVAGVVESTMRRCSFIVDIKRKSELSYPGKQFSRFDDAGSVAEAMVCLGADVVFVNVDLVS